MPAFNNNAYLDKKESVKFGGAFAPSSNVYSPTTPSFTATPPPSDTFSPSVAPTFTPTGTRFSASDELYRATGSTIRRSGLDRVFDALQVGQYAVAGGIRAAVRNQPIAEGFLGGIKAANPFGPGFREGEASFTDVFSELGWNPTSRIGKAARAIAGFTGDVLLDPLTYFSGGASALLTGSGKFGAKVAPKAGAKLVQELGQEVAEKAVSKAVQNVGKGLTKDIAEEVLTKAGISITDEVVEGLIMRTNKLSGIGQNLGDHLQYGFGKNKKILMDDSTLRMLGDSTIAPYINSIPNMINNTGLFKGLDAKRSMKLLSNYDIEKTANTLIAQDLRGRHSVSLAKNIATSKKTITKMTKYFDENDQIRLFDMLEDSDLWTDKLTTTGLKDNVHGNRLIGKYEEELRTAKTKVDEFNNLFEEKEKLVSELEGIDSITAKIERGAAKADLNRMKEYEALLKDTQTKIKQSLFDINAESADKIVKDVIVERRKPLFTNIPDATGKKVVTSTPYGFTKVGDSLVPLDRSANYLIDDYLTKPLNEFTKVNGKRVYATSTKSINNFLDGTNLTHKALQDKLELVLNSTPMMKHELSMLPLNPKLDDRVIREFLTKYANGTADDFIKESVKIRDGYVIAQKLALDETGGVFNKKYFDKLNDLMVDEPERLNLWNKNIDRLTDINATKVPLPKGYDKVKDLVDELNIKIDSGYGTPEDYSKLQDASKELDRMESIITSNSSMSNAQRETLTNSSPLTEAEINKINDMESIEGAKTIKDSYLDPWEDIEDVSKRAQEGDDFYDSFVFGSDVSPYKDRNFAHNFDDIVQKAKPKSLNDFLDGIFKETAEDNINAARAARATLNGNDVNKAAVSNASKSLNLTEKQVKNMNTYLGLDFDKAAKKIVNTNKRASQDYQRLMMQKFFPDKRLKDLSTLERTFINSKMNDAVKIGAIDQIDTEYFYKKFMEESESVIKDLNPQIEAIEQNLAQTVDGYWVQGEGLKAKIKAIESAINDPARLQEVERAKALRKELGQAFRDNKVDDYARSQLGMAYNQFVNWKKIPGSELTEFALKNLDSRDAKALTQIRGMLNHMAVIEESKIIGAYAPHIVREKYKKLYNNFVELTEEAIVGSDGRPFISSKMKREFTGTVKEYKRLWDEGLVNKNFPNTDIPLPRDLYEDTLVRSLTERALKHENYVFDTTNSNNILELTSKKYRTGSSVASGDITIVTKENLIKNYKGKLPEGEVLTTRYIKNDLAKHGIIIDLNSDTLYAKVTEGADNLSNAADEFGQKFWDVRTMDVNTANHFNQLSRYQKADGFKNVLDMYDNMLGLWKLNVTVVNPSFHARNALGNSFNSYLDIGVKAFSFKEKSRIAKIMSGEFTGDIVTKKGVKYSADEIVQIAQQLDVIDSGQFGSEIRELMEASKKTNAKWSKWNPLNAASFEPYRAGTKVGSFIENNDKMLNFIHHIEEGLDPQAAAEFTQHFLFDYKTATVFEKEVMRRTIPFWTWAKKNIPLQMEQVIKHPEKYRPFVKGLQALDNSNTGDEDITFDRGNEAGEFAEDWVTLPGRGDRAIKIYNPNMPFQDLSIDVKSLVGRLSPFIKVPYELATDTNVYYDQPLDGKLAHLAKQLGPISNAVKLKDKQGEDRLLEILAQLTGLRFLSYGKDKYNYRKVIQDIEQGKE